MTFLQDDNNNVIVLPEDFVLTRAACDLFNFEIRGDYSVSFQIPNNVKNKNSIGYFNPMQSPNPAFTASIFNLVKDGNILVRGKLVIEREDAEYLYMFFISGNTNWMNSITGSIKDLDFDDYTLTYIDSAINGNKANTTGFVFPLVDWAYKFQKATIYYKSKNIGAAGGTDYNSVFNDFYPCFFLASAMIEVMKNFNLKIGGNILTDPLYNSLIITPDAGQMMRAPKFYNDRKSVTTLGSNMIITNVQTKIPLNNLISDGTRVNYNTTTQGYTASKSFLLEVLINAQLSSSQIVSIVIFKNGSPGFGSLSSQTQKQVYKSNENGDSVNTFEVASPVITGDFIEAYIQLGLSNRGNYDASGNTFPATGGSGGGGTVNLGDCWRISVAGTLGGTAVHVGDMIYALVSSPGGTAGNWQIVAFNSLTLTQAGTLFTFAPRQNLNYFGAGADTLRASDVLPSLQCLDLIKFVANYFCCIVTFDISTQTVNFNILDSFRFENAVDWSSYIQKYENSFAINTAQNNFIRVLQPDDSLLTGYNSSNYLSTIDPNNNIVIRNNLSQNYGEALLVGQSQTQVYNNLFSIPFGPAVDRMTNSTYNDAGQLQAGISLIDLTDDGSSFAFIKVNNDGSGNAQFQCTSTNFTLVVGQVVRIFGTGFYDGYAISNGSSQTTILSVLYTIFTCAGMLYTGTATGSFYIQKVSFKSNQSRLLYYVPSASVPGFGNNANITVNYQAVDHVLTTIGWAYYSKPTVNLTISSFKQGVNPGALNILGYNDVPASLTYFKIVKRILQMPYTKIWAYLPGWAFAQFQFGTFIFINDEDQQKYYLVDSIEEYKDVETLCQINLLLIQ